MMIYLRRIVRPQYEGLYNPGQRYCWTLKHVEKRYIGKKLEVRVHDLIYIGKQDDVICRARKDFPKLNIGISIFPE